MTDFTAIPGRVLEKARAKGWMIATAESCTGGRVASALTAIAGASDVYDRGFVTYSNDAKQAMLGVSPETLDSFGAVSEQTAREMADGALAHSAASLAVAITGVAGPGASDAKPEGMVCFAVKAAGQATLTLTRHFGALGRTAVQQASTETALSLLEQELDR